MENRHEHLIDCRLEFAGVVLRGHTSYSPRLRRRFLVMRGEQQLDGLDHGFLDWSAADTGLRDAGRREAFCLFQNRSG